MSAATLADLFALIALARWSAVFTAVCRGLGRVPFNSSFDFVIEFVLSKGSASSLGTPLPCTSRCAEIPRNGSLDASLSHRRRAVVTSIVAEWDRCGRERADAHYVAR